LAANINGLCFIRTGRPANELVYENNTEFGVGKAMVVRESDKDQVVIVGAGVTLFEAIKAADQLEKDGGIHTCIIDPFTIKPLDGQTIAKHVKRCGNRIVVVEDHYAEGGIGEAVFSAMAANKVNILSRHLCVRELPRSGGPDELIVKYGIGANSIVDAVKQLLG